MSHYPTDDNFKDEREEPFDDGIDCIENSTHAINGHCPCCGNEVSTKGGDYDDSALRDYCETCGWVGDFYYD